MKTKWTLACGFLAAALALALSACGEPAGGDFGGSAGASGFLGQPLSLSDQVHYATTRLE